MYRILLVDDEELVLKSLAHTVEWEDYGFSIGGTASSGKEAYEKALELKPELVMTDIRMQGIGGLELIQMVKRELPGTRFIILSGYAEFAYAKKAMELGAIGYCLKPFEDQEIISFLKRVKTELDQERRNTAEAAPDSSDRKPKKEKTEKSASKNQTYLELVEYVNLHYMEEVTPAALAEKFHINISYLSQLFKKESGVTYTEYLTDLRIRQACRLLCSTDAKIADVAEMVGFHDYFYFARVFKKVMNMSPGEYRGE